MSWKNDLFSVPSFGVVTEIAKSVPPVPSLPLCSLFFFYSYFFFIFAEQVCH